MKIEKICKICEKKYLAIRRKQKYCSVSCRQKAALDKLSYEPIGGQLCWRCQKATGGCSWSRCFKPVDGWEAKRVKMKDCDWYTYDIKSCPEFLEDEKRVLY